jgi:hypothetical protein
MRDMSWDVRDELVGLPTRSRPVDVPEADLRQHVEALLQFLVARVRRALWETTCEWERIDYPRLARLSPILHGIRPHCGTPPRVPAHPGPPQAVVGPGSSREATEEEPTTTGEVPLGTRLSAVWPIAVRGRTPPTLVQRTPETGRELDSPLPTPLESRFDEAVRLVMRVDPEIGEYLARASLDRTRTIREVRIVDEHGRVEEHVFQLRVTARFTPGDPMEIHVDVSHPDDQVSVEDLARVLLHEGVHMALEMDRHLPASHRSERGRDFDSYLERARESGHYAQLEALILQVLTNAFPNEPRSDLERSATRLIRRLLEEAYATREEDRHSRAIYGARVTRHHEEGWLRPWVHSYLSSSISSAYIVSTELENAVLNQLHGVVDDLGGP